MSESRKLAAILVADVVGYSRLAGTDEDRTLARLRALRSDLIDPPSRCIMGGSSSAPGTAASSNSEASWMRCTAQSRFKTASSSATPACRDDKRIEFRVGIHLGDVVEESDGDLMGDGVNVAARLEGICEPGAICLSEDAYRQVKSRLELRVTDLGPTEAQEHRRASARLFAAPGRDPNRETLQSRDEARGAGSPARRSARCRVRRGGRLRFACGARAAPAGRLRRRRQTRDRAAPFNRRAAVREPERRQGARLFRRRDHRRSDY